MSNKLIENAGSINIDLNDPNNYSDKPLNEVDTRKRFLSYARLGGFEKEMLLLFAKYDKMLRLCPDEKERQDIAKLGAAEAVQLIFSAGHVLR